MVPPKAPLTKIARQRLKIIEEFADLGSGFKIAMRDLEIRGAGNMLGTEQSGFIAAVGFDLYNELLKETIAELKGEKVERPPDVEMNIKVDTYIPEEYIADAGERVLFYRRLSETVSLNEVKAIEEEMIDRFGRPPQQVLNLLDSTYIRHLAAQAGITEISTQGHEVVLAIPETIEVTRASVEKIVRKSPVILNFSFQNGMRISFSPPEDKQGFLGGIKKVLQALII
jgi:transcription-repair coupling factor (superfamily II helicase)